jgi:hypothetical protein
MHHSVHNNLSPYLAVNASHINLDSFSYSLSTGPQNQRQKRIAHYLEMHRRTPESRKSQVPIHHHHIPDLQRDALQRDDRWAYGHNCSLDHLTSFSLNGRGLGTEPPFSLQVSQSSVTPLLRWAQRLILAVRIKFGCSDNLPPLSRLSILNAHSSAPRASWGVVVTLLPLPLVGESKMSRAKLYTILHQNSKSLEIKNPSPPVLLILSHANYKITKETFKIKGLCI